MVLPKVGGVEVIKPARLGVTDLPVIYNLEYAQKSVVREVESMDDVGFRPKLFTLKQLMMTVKVSLDRSHERAIKLR